MSSYFYFFCCYFITQLLIFMLALAIDLAFGDPPERLERFYPIVWISRLMYFFDRITKRGNANKEKVLGVIYAVLIAAIFTIPCLTLLMLMAPYPYEVLYVILAVPVFKMTFTVKGLERYAQGVITAADLEAKREAVSKIVSRDVSHLDMEHLNSAAIESVAENLTDSVIAPFFYFALFGVPAAMLYRVINTLDAVVGYKTDRYRHFGWFAARADDIMNYIPERIAAALILLAGGRPRCDAVEKGRRVHRTIVAMCSVLRVKVEKLGHYSVTGRDSSNGYEAPRTEHIAESIRVVKRSALIFALCYAIITISGYMCLCSVRNMLLFVILNQMLHTSASSSRLWQVY